MSFANSIHAARSIALLAALCIGFTLTAIVAGAQVRPPASVSFYKEVLPIFRSACSGCHNGDSAAGGLNLTSYAAASKGGRGGALFIPGKGSESRITKYLTGALKPQMPPGGALKPGDIDRIRLWIDAGAKFDTPPNAVIRPGALPTRSVREVSHSMAPHSSTLFVLKRAAPVTALAFGPDGKTLAVGTYREVQFWNLETKALESRWTGHADTVRGLAYSRDGRLLAAGGGSPGATGEVRIWDVMARKEIRVFGDHTDAVNGIAFSPDGTRIATASSDKTIKTWEVATGKLIAAGKDHSDSVWGVAWSPDGKYLASCGADHSVKIWDAPAMKRLYSLSGHEDVVYSVEFSADSKTILTASADHTARVWNIGPDGGSTARTLAAHSQTVMNASFGANGAVATASGDKTLRLWDSGGAVTRTLKDAQDWLYVVRFSRDGKTVAAGAWDGAILIWNMADGKPLAKFFTGAQHGS